MTKQGFAWILLITRLLLFFPHSTSAHCNRVAMKAVLSHLQSSNQQEFSEYCLRFTDIIIDSRRTVRSKFLVRLRNLVIFTFYQNFWTICSLEQKTEICRNTSVSCLTLSFQSVFSLMDQLFKINRGHVCFEYLRDIFMECRAVVSQDYY